MSKKLSAYNAHMKRYLGAHMKKGMPKAARKAVFKAGAAAWRAGGHAVRKVKKVAKGTWAKAHGTSRSTPKKGGHKMGHRIARFGMPSLVGLALTLFALVKFGIWDALIQLKDGNWQGAAKTITGRFNLGNVLAVVMPAVAVTVARGVTGPVNLATYGRYRLRVY